MRRSRRFALLFACWCATLPCVLQENAGAAPPATPMAASAATPAAPRARDTTQVTILVVRHAEKDTTVAGNDPPLTPAGLTRARTLARMLGESGVTAVYATPTRRAIDTGAPLAGAIGDSVHVVAGTPALLERLRTRHWGDRVLVVGHSNTVPAIVEGLSGWRPAAIADPEYDLLFVVTLHRGGKPSVLTLRYGEPSLR